MFEYIFFYVLSKLGFLVILPDYYRGKMKDPAEDGLVEFVTAETQWSKLKLDWEEKIAPYAKKHGAQVFGSVGKPKKKDKYEHFS